MIELKISCEPDALDAHMKALGFERQKCDDGMPEIAMPDSAVARSSRLKFHGDDKSPIVTSTPETRKTYEIEAVRRYVEAYGRQNPWVLDVIPDDLLRLYDKLQFTSTSKNMKFSELLEQWKKDPEFTKAMKELSAEKWAAKALEIAENGTLAQQGQLVMTAMVDVAKRVVADLNTLDAHDKAVREAEGEPDLDEPTNGLIADLPEGTEKEALLAESVALRPPTSAREPGKPGPGRQRRTRAEIAEDEAYFAAQENKFEAAREASVEAAGDKPNISTGEPRIDPQDAADEAAETEATKGDKLTRDAVRAAFKRYSDVVGTAVAVIHIRSILGAPIAEIPETEEALTAAIAKIDAAIARAKPADKLTTFIEEVKVEAASTASLFGASESAAELEIEQTISAEDAFLAALKAIPKEKRSKDDAILAVRAYGLKFDGEDGDLSKMPNTLADVPRILTPLFGDAIKSLTQIDKSEEAYGKVCAAFRLALATNPFERTVLR